MTTTTQTPTSEQARSYWLAEGRAARAGGYGLIALVSVGTLLFSRDGPTEILISGAATSGVFLYGFMQFNPRYVGIELILLALVGYALLPSAPVYWMLGSALGGGVAAILTLRDAEEDDQFFLPPLATALLTFILFCVGQEGGWAQSLAIIGRYVATYRASFDAMLAIPENAELHQKLIAMDSWDRLHGWIGLIAASALLGLWAIVLWLINRFARRRTGRIQGVFNSLLLFRIRPGYTFLLIAALVFEILSAWLGREDYRYLSYPLFALCGAAFLMVHVGVVFFMAALRRASSGGAPTVGFSLFMLLALALSLYVGPFIGLADVWLDFRKTKLLRDRLS